MNPQLPEGNNHHHDQQDKVAHMRDKTRYGGLDLGTRHGPFDPVGHELDEPMAQHQDEDGKQQVAEWMEGLKKPDDLIHSHTLSPMKAIEVSTEATAANTSSFSRQGSRPRYAHPICRSHWGCARWACHASEVMA